MQLFLQPTLVVGATFILYLVAAAAFSYIGGLRSMSDKFHEFGGVVAAFIALFLNACALEANESRLERHLDHAQIEGFYDEDWNIYLHLLGEGLLPQTITIVPVFYRRGMEPIPTHTGQPVRIHEGEYEKSEPGRSIFIRDAGAILCERQADRKCQGMKLVHVSALVDDQHPIRIDKKLSDAE